MSYGLITVTSSAYGEEWSNTWGVQVGVEVISGGLTEADIDNIRGGASLSDDATSPGGDVEAYEGAVSPLAAIIGFHRLMQIAPVIVQRISISDGQKNGAGSVFWNQELGYPCLRTVPVGETDEFLVPLSIAWLIARNPFGYSQKAGRLYLRGALVDTQVRPGTRVGVQWKDPASATAGATLLSTSVGVSNLQNWFGESEVTPDVVSLGIPNYGNTDLTRGEVASVARITTLSSVGPKSRQLTRGKKRKQTTDGGD